MAVKTYSNSSTGSSRARKTQFIRIVRMIVTSNTKYKVRHDLVHLHQPGWMIALIAAFLTGLKGEKR